MLERLIRELQNQSTEGLFTYSTVIIDNDFAQSARNIVEETRKDSGITIDYYCEAEQNIALARNKAVQNASGDYLAFIDDDEIPCRKWLLNLYQSINTYKADGVLGPVLPSYAGEPPKWVIKGRLCERKAFETGTAINNPRDTRTGNVLINGNIFRTDKEPFDYRLGKTGGEDVDFFRRKLEQRHIFIWCNEAYVHEIVPQHRLKRSYFIRRALLRGRVSANNITLISVSAVKSIVAFSLYTAALPFLLLLGHHLFMKYLIKDCDHIGKLLALFRINLIKERSS